VTDAAGAAWLDRQLAALEAEADNGRAALRPDILSAALLACLDAGVCEACGRPFGDGRAVYRNRPLCEGCARRSSETAPPVWVFWRPESADVVRATIEDNE